MYFSNQDFLSDRNSNLTWKPLRLAVKINREQTVVSYAHLKIDEILISYGTVNNNQSYGGGTVVIKSNECKPCFLPIYHGENKVINVIYIYNTASVGNEYAYSIVSNVIDGSIPCLINIWVR